MRNFDLRWFPDTALTVVMAAKGYPGSYGKGSVIEGLDAAAEVEGVEIFHAGTAEQGRTASSPTAAACSMSARSARAPRRRRRAPMPPST